MKKLLWLVLLAFSFSVTAPAVELTPGSKSVAGAAAYKKKHKMKKHHRRKHRWRMAVEVGLKGNHTPHLVSYARTI